MINWKDFLYYSKNDKLAIILLIILICISGAISIYLNKFSSIDLSYLNQQDSIQKEFVEFEQNLVQAVILNDTNEIRKGVTSKLEKTISKKLEIGETIDLNSASSKMLIRVPGIGNTIAERIVEYRKSLGGFFEIEQLLEIKGITHNKFSQILPYFQIIKRQQKININSISLQKLSEHPYFNETYIEIVRRLREQGKISSIDQLGQDQNFKQKDIERIAPYISF